MPDFSTVFKNLRKDNNLTQAELAKKLGVAPSTVGMYERGQREPDFETLEKIEKGEVTPIKQNESEATYAPIIKKEMAHLDFTQDAETISCTIRGYYSWPCAYFFLDGKRIKVISAKVSNMSSKEPGEVIDNNNKLIISCGNNTSIELLTVQLEGSKAMTAAQMQRKNKIPLGTKVN